MAISSTAVAITIGHSGCDSLGGPCVEQSTGFGSEQDGQQVVSSSDSASGSGTNYSNEENELAIALDIIKMTHDWDGVDSGSSDSQCDGTEVGRRTRYRNLALAIEAVESAQRDKVPKPCAFGNKFQAATGFIIFVAVNLRFFDSVKVCLGMLGYVIPLPCADSGNRKGLMLWFVLFLITDMLFIVFQLACVYRDRQLATRLMKLRKIGAYGKALALHLYNIVILGVCSGWQILRSVRQIKDPGYRDSFLAELNDPGMVSVEAYRMPLYSSHLTFLFELPFVCRVVHVFTRDMLMVCDITYCLAWLFCFQLVVIAVVTFDYSVSSYIREQYASSSASRFLSIHVLYRVSECLTRVLTMCAAMLRVVAAHFPVTAIVVLVADLLITLIVLCLASKTISKRVLFLNLPFFGANLALFADECGIAGSSHRVTQVLDITRAIEVGLAVACFLCEIKFTRDHHTTVGESYSYRLAVCLSLLLVSCAVCWALRACSLVQVAKGDAAVDREGATDQQPKQPHEKSETIFGRSLNDSFHYQGAASGDFASMLFSKGIGDQFASLLEIFWESDDIRLSRLKVAARLGEGGFGRVFKVQDTRSGREYAMKLQRKERATTVAVREAEFLHEICHPFIVRLERIFRTSAFYGILLELCEGDLNRLILEHERPRGIVEGLSTQEAKHLASCMVVALEHLHRRKIVFRDLKPENVLTLASRCSNSGVHDAKLADFGLAKFVGKPAGPCDREAVQPTISLFSAVVGTPAFMCSDSSHPVGIDASDPDGAVRLLASRDWYALGCCLMLMLLGERGCRVARSAHGDVLLPPPHCEIHSALHDNAGNLVDGQALALLLNLTTDSAAERAGAQEIRDSPFMREAIQEVDRWVGSHGGSNL